MNSQPSSNQSVISNAGLTKAPWTSVLLNPLFKALIFASLITHLIKVLSLFFPKPCTMEAILIEMSMWVSLISLRNSYRGRIWLYNFRFILFCYDQFISLWFFLAPWPSFLVILLKYIHMYIHIGLYIYLYICIHTYVHVLVHIYKIWDSVLNKMKTWWYWK